MATASVDFKAALDRSAIELIDNTPTREEMEGYASEIKSKFLKGLKLPLDIDVKDSEQFAQQVMANTAASMGIQATAKNIQEWAKVPINELSAKVGVNLDGLADGTMMATAQAGLDTASKAYGESYQLFSLTEGVLTDANLDVVEAIQLGASAVSMASTLIASAAGGAALGPYGAVAGVILGAVSYFTSSAERAKQAEAAAMEKIYAQMTAEKQQVDTYNLKELAKYKERLEVLWEAKDSAVALVADSWAAYEQELGVRFGLRYFPNSPPPIRAGLKKQGSQGKNLQVYCTSPGGCLYFPEPTPARIKALGYEKAMLELVDTLAKRGFRLFDPSPSKRVEDQYVATEQGFSAYYDRTLRAFSAYLREGTFWEPKSTRNTSVLAKGYGHHLIDLYNTGKIPTLKSNQVPIGNGRSNVTCTSTFPQVSSSSPEVLNNVLFAKGKYTYGATTAAEQQFAQWQADAMKCIKGTWNMNVTPAKMDVVKVGENNILDAKRRLFEGAENFWFDLNEALEQEQNAANVFKTRIAGDLIQTANAVGGELATSIRLQEIMSQTGTRSIQELTKSASSLKAVPSETLAKVERTQKRDGLINNVMLAMGVGAVGYGAKRKWG